MTRNRVASGSAGVKLCLGMEPLAQAPNRYLYRELHVTGLFLTPYERSIELNPLYSASLEPAHNLTILPAFN